jgi:hypothetical protein
MTDQEQITASKIVNFLDKSTQDLDAATLARLAHARQQAVAAMKQPQHVWQPVFAGWQHLQELSRYAGPRFWLPIILLLAALVATLGSQMNRQRDIDTDSLLLASELPPEAYADKEFVAWLESASRQ